MMQSRFLRPDGGEDAVPRVFLPRRRTAPDDHARPTCALIVTAENSANDAVRAHLSNLRTEVYRATLYERGTFSAHQQACEIGILELSDDASSEIETAIRYFQPHVTLFVGVVAALQGVQPGDIVNATKIYACYATTCYATTWQMSAALEQRARAVASSPDWLQLVQERSTPLAPPRAIFAPIMAKDRSMPLTDTLDFTHSQFRDAVALGEHSVLASLAEQHNDALIICGVVPISNYQKSTDHWQAAQHASAFAFAVLTHLSEEGGSQPVQHIQSSEQTEPEQEAYEALEVFYSYVDKDKELAEKLQRQLAMLKRNGLIEDWHTGKIAAGGDLDEHLRHLETARLILLLISPDYLSSERHYQEMTRAMERQRVGKAQVVPVLLRPTNDWQEAAFSKLQVIPRSGKAVTQFKNQDEALREVAKEISVIVKQLKHDGK